LHSYAGAGAVHPIRSVAPKANRRWKSCFSRSLYKERNAIKRMFCRLKDSRRLATRYDRTAAIFLGSMHLAASILWFFVSPSPNLFGSSARLR
jgi:transposase